MIDGLFSGLLGGLFGPALAAWMSRFRYRAIFLFVTFATYTFLFLSILVTRGPKFAFERLCVFWYRPEIVLTSMGAGLLAVLVAFVGSVAAPTKGDVPENMDK